MDIPSNFSKSGDGVSDQFPAGLRVLVVDDDPLCLRILKKMLSRCLYKVTECNRAEIAMTLLRDNKNCFDIVLSDVHMPDMDGFKLLEQVGLEMDLPVIMMSADDSKIVVMKGVTHGACDYLIKPVRMEALKNIWQHVIRKKKFELEDKDIEQSVSVKDGEQNIDNSSSENEVILKKSRKRDDDDQEEDEDEDEVDEDTDTCAPKKPRIVWSVDLHQKFVDAVNRCASDKVVPAKILELMNVPGLKRANVASHLQKYRMYLERLRVDIQQQNQNEINNSSYINKLKADLQLQNQNGINNSNSYPDRLRADNQYVINNSPYNGSSNTNFENMSSLHGIDFLAQPTSQIPVHSLVTLQDIHRPSNISPISIADQRNMFSFEPVVGLAQGVSSHTIYNPSVVDFSPLYGNSSSNTGNIIGPSELQDDVNVGSKRFVPSYYELQRYDSHPYVQTSGHGRVSDGFNPNFGMPSDFDVQFTVGSLQDASYPSNIFSSQHLSENDILYNTLVPQKSESEIELDTFPLSNNLLT